MGFLAVATLLLLVVGTVSPITLRRGPDATVARAGETVELRCDVNFRDGEPVLWYHDSTKNFVTYNRDVSDTLDEDRKQRYSVQGSEYWHVFNLRIENLKPVDDGFFYCGYMDERFQVLGSARLTVIYPPAENSPVCSFNLLDQSNTSIVAVGNSVDLICMWTGGSPSPAVVWYRQDVSMDTHKEEGFAWTRKELTAEDNGIEFICEMESQALDEKRSCSAMPLRILPRATISPPTAFARVGDTVEFVCEGTGLPEITSYAWEVPTRLTRRPGRFELRAGNRVFRLLAVEAEDDGLEVRCRVRTRFRLQGTVSAVLRVVLPTTLSPTTVPDTTTEAAPTTTPQPTGEEETASVTVGIIDNDDVLPRGPQTTPALPPPDDTQPIATLPKTTIIGIGVAAGAVLMVIIIVVLTIFMRKSRKSPIQRDRSTHLVNCAYEMVIEGVVINPSPPPAPGFQNYDRPRPIPIAAVSPLPQVANPETGVKPSVRYAKVNKKKPRTSDPLYDRVSDETDVDLGLKGRTPRREPTYVNQGAMEIRQEPNPREFNAEGLTYAELELDREGRLHSKKNNTLYAKLK